MGDDAIKRNISKNISKYREKAGISQKELAKQLGVVPSRISNWETGANCPTIDILFEVCKILNVSINDIYGVYPDSKFVLKYEEQEMITKYRAIDEHGKELVSTILDKEYERSIDFSIQLDEENTIILEAPKRSNEDKTRILKYNELLPNAAHERTDIDVTKEMKKHDDDIMDDENF